MRAGTQIWWLLLGALALTWAAAGCDVGYELIVENHQDREVRLVMGPIDFQSWVEPCTVDTIVFHAPPPYGQSFSIEARDRDGNVVHQDSVVFESGPNGPNRATMRVPGRTASECPSMRIKPTPTPGPTLDFSTTPRAKPPGTP
jgi:hypothetical protein